MKLQSYFTHKYYMDLDVYVAEELTVKLLDMGQNVPFELSTMAQLEDSRFHY